MRILLALDGSHGADIAHDLVRGLPWPAGSRIDVLRVIEPVFDVFVMPTVSFDGSMADVLGATEIEAELRAEVADLTAADLEVATDVVVGRPATIIVETAARLGSDLIVLGSRGRGPIGSMVLGSVSAEVSDHAHCPVLVARTTVCGRGIVGLDGTPVADRMVDAIVDMPFLRDTALEIVSVAPSLSPGPGLMLSGAYGLPVAWYEESVITAGRALGFAAAAAAERLRVGGRATSWQVLHGDPAAMLIEHGRETGADLLIVGTHGRSGMTRLLLGSVTRNVLLHAHASVLVLRTSDLGPSPHAATAIPEPAEPLETAVTR